MENFDNNKYYIIIVLKDRQVFKIPFDTLEKCTDNFYSLISELETKNIITFSDKDNTLYVINKDAVELISASQMTVEELIKLNGDKENGTELN